MLENKIGFHARSLNELKKVISVKEVNMVELKPSKLKKNDRLELYHFDGERFTVDHEAASYLKRLCDKKGVKRQIHLPYAKKHDGSTEEGLCQADESHHDMLLDRFEMYARLYDRYRIGEVLTIHPPLFRVNGEQLWTQEKALEAGRMFYAKLDALIEKKGFGYKVGIENMVKPKKRGTSNIGYTPNQIDHLIGNTRNIGITVDSGHRRLNNDMSIAKLISYGSIVNCHFHSNPGIVSEDYSDDAHIFAVPETFPHYWRYIKGFKRRDTPIVLEIDKLMGFSKKTLGKYVMGLRKDIGKRDKN